MLFFFFFFPKTASRTYFVMYIIFRSWFSKQYSRSANYIMITFYSVFSGVIYRDDNQLSSGLHYRMIQISHRDSYVFCCSMWFPCWHCACLPMSQGLGVLGLSLNVLLGLPGLRADTWMPCSALGKDVLPFVKTGVDLEAIVPLKQTKLRKKNTTQLSSFA